MNRKYFQLLEAMRQGHQFECGQLLAAGGRQALSGLDGDQEFDLFAAAIHAPDHNLALVQLLLNCEVNPNCIRVRLSECYQSTPVLQAANAGRLDIVKLLASAGADIHWCSPTGANAASESFPTLARQAPCIASPGLAGVGEWLAQQGVRMDPACQDSRRKLCWAAAQPRSWPDVPRLLSLGVDPGALAWTPLMMRITSDTASVRDVEQSSPEDLSHRDAYERTPLHLAVMAGRQDLVEAMLAKGCDISQRSWCGGGVLHLAASHGQVKLIEWLVRVGIDIEIHTEHHHTPLDEAVSEGQLGSVHCLLRLGANAQAIDGNGYQVIHRADSKPVLAALLDAGADVNAISGGGDWPLKDAAISGDAERIEFLLGRGAIADLTSTGETALFNAVRSGSLECVTLLLDAGANVNAQDVDGWTCLWCVKSMPMAELLLAHGADPAIGDQCGSLPEEWSVPSAVAERFRDIRRQTLNDDEWRQRHGY